MEFRTQVTIDTPPFLIEPCEEILFVGSCFADAIGQRFRDEAFPATVNPYGVMYNPASILHTRQRIAAGVPAAAASAGAPASPAVSGFWRNRRQLPEAACCPFPRRDALC